LLTRAAHCRECVFAGVYRAATVRESVPNDFFSSLLKNQLTKNGSCGRSIASNNP